MIGAKELSPSRCGCVNVFVQCNLCVTCARNSLLSCMECLRTSHCFRWESQFTMRSVVHTKDSLGYNLHE